MSRKAMKQKFTKLSSWIEFLAHAHNEMEQTALIVAAKRNNLSIARLLLMFKSNQMHRD